MYIERKQLEQHDMTGICYVQMLRKLGGGGWGMVKAGILRKMNIVDSGSYLLV